MNKIRSNGFGRGVKGSAGTYAVRGGKVVRIDAPSSLEGTYAPDFSKGPITLYSELRKGDAAQGLDWHRHDEHGFPQVANTRELRNYEARNKHAGIPLEWTR